MNLDDTEPKSPTSAGFLRLAERFPQHAGGAALCVRLQARASGAWLIQNRWVGVSRTRSPEGEIEHRQSLARRRPAHHSVERRRVRPPRQVPEPAFPHQRRAGRRGCARSPRRPVSSALEPAPDGHLPPLTVCRRTAARLSTCVTTTDNPGGSGPGGTGIENSAVF